MGFNHFDSSRKDDSNRFGFDRDESKKSGISHSSIHDSKHKSDFHSSIHDHKRIHESSHFGNDNIRSPFNHKN